MRRVPIPLVWLAGAVPLALLIADTLGNRLGADPVVAIEHRLGRTALYFIIASLTITPLMRLGRINLIRYRRALGLLGFSYALLHVAAWVVLDMGLLWGQILRDVVKRPYLIVGMAAFLILLVMAATSSDSAIRRLGARRWKTLHRAIYAGVLLGILHWLWAYKLWPDKAVAIGVGVVVILALRLPVVDQRLRALRNKSFNIR